MAARTRRVVTIDGAGKIAVRTEPVPELVPGAVLVEVKSSLVSPGTELGGVPAMRKNPNADAPPRPFGYGNAGIVLDMGEGVEGIADGMRVTCMGSGYALHATEVVVPQNLVVPIPKGLTFDEAAFAHLAATALHAVRRGRLEFGSNVMVTGLGVVGQIAAQIAKASGAHVAGVDRLPMRLRIARECGADFTVNSAREDLAAKMAQFTRGYGVDTAIVAFGGDATEAIREILKTMKTAPDGHRMGAIVIVGGAKFEASWPTGFGNVDVRASSRPGPGYHDEAWEYGRDYPQVFVEWTTKRNLEEVLRAAAEDTLKLRALITHRVGLEKAPAACEELIEHPDKALGVILNP